MLYVIVAAGAGIVGDAHIRPDRDRPCPQAGEQSNFLALDRGVNGGMQPRETIVASRAQPSK